MSTSVLVAKERQPISSSGLGQKQAKKQKIGRKCATVAPYLLFDLNLFGFSSAYLFVKLS